MKTKLLAVLGLAAVAGGSFFAVTQFFDETEAPISVASMTDRAVRLEKCIADNTNTNSKCMRQAATLARDMPQAGFSIERKSGFDVYINQDRIVFVKQNCKPDDLAVKSFVWAVYPNDPSELPDAAKQAGYVGGSADFAKTGITTSETCVLTGKLPFSAFKKFEAGQYNRGTGRWVWFVT